jgi:hypothetical protein
MTDESDHSEPLRRHSLRELSWPNRFARIFNRTALGAGLLALGWLLLNAYWLRSALLVGGLIAAMYLQHRLDTP